MQTYIHIKICFYKIPAMTYHCNFHLIKIHVFNVHIMSHIYRICYKFLSHAPVDVWNAFIFYFFSLQEILQEVFMC